MRIDSFPIAIGIVTYNFIQIFFSSVKKFNASNPPSLPTPDDLTPPKGTTFPRGTHFRKIVFMAFCTVSGWKKWNAKDCRWSMAKQFAG